MHLDVADKRSWNSMQILNIVIESIFPKFLGSHKQWNGNWNEKSVFIMIAIKIVYRFCETPQILKYFSSRLSGNPNVSHIAGVAFGSVHQFNICIAVNPRCLPKYC